jgi:hypothetical protein
MSETEKVKPKRASRAKKAVSTAKDVTIIAENSIIEETSQVLENVHFSIVQDNSLLDSPHLDGVELDKIKYIEETVQNMKTSEFVDEVSEKKCNESVSLADDSSLKKRGRKPKGGKIIQLVTPLNENVDAKPTVILHLKCFIKDLKIQQDSSIDFYNISSNSCFGVNSTSTTDFCYTTDSYSNINDSTEISSIYVNNPSFEQPGTNASYNEKDADMKEIWKKLKQLEHLLHGNNVSDKKSACFWCTYDFDNPPIYIPKYFLKNSYHVYGCFCSPECSVAYLMNENLDSSNKFERYHLLNHIYAKIYDYKKNIKPAPNPFYMLEKYYGNMTIQEYRALLSNERLFLIVDKPLTRIMPELHQDNEEHIINNRKIIQSNTQNTKKKIAPRKVQTKSTIVNEKFGMATSSTS